MPFTKSIQFSTNIACMFLTSLYIFKQIPRRCQIVKKQNRGEYVVQHDGNFEYTEDDIFIIGIQGKNRWHEHMIHLLVIPDNVIFPASIHQLLVVNGENGEPGRVVVLKGCGGTKTNKGNTENETLAFDKNVWCIHYLYSDWKSNSPWLSWLLFSRLEPEIEEAFGMGGGVGVTNWELLLVRPVRLNTLFFISFISILQIHITSIITVHWLF